ncbi:MAG: 3-oxoacyl-ACP synthase III [Burkholderiales bacterium]
MSPKYSKVYLTALGYELGSEVVTSDELEDRLLPVYRSLNLQAGQLEAWTGIAERRWWPKNMRLSQGAAAAARKALAKSAVDASDIEVLIYAGVCRENFEPATACAVADALGVKGSVSVYDLSNACLGVLNGMLDIANRIELGQIRAGVVVSCETAREINEIALAHLSQGVTMDEFAQAIATFTGGSGAVAMLLTDGSFPGDKGHRVLGAASLVAPEHHELCRWGLQSHVESGDVQNADLNIQSTIQSTIQSQYMLTDSVSVLKYGVLLGQKTWAKFQEKMAWSEANIDRVICHQVGSGHQEAILKSLGVPKEKDFTTFKFLGNMGTAALPVTAAIAEERGVLRSGQNVAFLGIGSGLTCLMMGLKW